MFERMIVMLYLIDVKTLSQMSPYKQNKAQNFSSEFFTVAWNLMELWRFYEKLSKASWEIPIHSKKLD